MNCNSKSGEKTIMWCRKFSASSLVAAPMPYRRLLLLHFDAFWRKTQMWNCAITPFGAKPYLCVCDCCCCGCAHLCIVCSTLIISPLLLVPIEWPWHQWFSMLFRWPSIRCGTVCRIERRIFRCARSYAQFMFKTGIGVSTHSHLTVWNANIWDNAWRLCSMPDAAYIGSCAWHTIYLCKNVIKCVCWVRSSTTTKKRSTLWYP